MAAKRARKPSGADAPGKRQKMAPLPTTPPIPFFAPFAHRKLGHMAEARLPEGPPLTPTDISPLHWDDETLEEIVESINQYASTKRKLLPVYLVRYRKWKPVSIGEFRRFVSTTILMGYE